MIHFQGKWLSIGANPEIINILELSQELYSSFYNFQQGKDEHTEMSEMKTNLIREICYIK
jgi:hypothetical protein